MFMHQGSAREHTLNPSHLPSPCSLALPHPAPTPPPHSPTLPSGPFHTIACARTYTQAHSLESFLISFHSEKQDEGALSD